MKLLLVAPCNWVLSDPEVGHSLIGVFHDITVKLPPGTEIPDYALLPREWAIFSKWELAPEEQGRNFFLVTEVYWPDGTKLNEAKIKAPASIAGVPAISFIMRNQGFPFGQNGKLKIKLRVEEDDGADVKIVHETVEIEISVQTRKDLSLA